MKEKLNNFWENHGGKVKLGGVVIGVGLGVAATVYYGHNFKAEALVDLEELISVGNVVDAIDVA